MPTTTSARCVYASPVRLGCKTCTATLPLVAAARRRHRRCRSNVSAVASDRDEAKRARRCAKKKEVSKRELFLRRPQVMQPRAHDGGGVSTRPNLTEKLHSSRVRANEQKQTVAAKNGEQKKNVKRQFAEAKNLANLRSAATKQQTASACDCVLSRRSFSTGAAGCV